MENTQSSTRVLLRGVAPSFEVKSEDVYFAFPDGRLDYDCQSCGATCCKGHGYVLHQGRELMTQIQKRPAAMLFLETAPTRGQDAFLMKNSPPGCFFLQPDNNCRIQLESGYAAKPETCRLFPFNHLRRVASTLIVRPHPSLCPLSVTPNGSQSARSSHVALLASMAEFGLATTIPSAFPRTADLTALFTLERLIARHSAESLELTRYSEFAALQLAVARSGPAATVGPSHATELDALFESIGRVLNGTPSMKSMTHGASIRALVAATPALRAELLFPDSPATGRQTPRDLDSDHVTRMLSALSVLIGFAHDAGMDDITYQTVLRIFSQNTELLVLLSAADQVVVWSGDASIAVPFDGPHEWQLRYLELARALLPAVQLKRRAPMFELIAANAFADPLLNLLFVKQFARTVAGKLATISSDAANPGKFSLRSSSQRWALQHAPIDALARIAQRKRKTKTPS